MGRGKRKRPAVCLGGQQVPSESTQFLFATFLGDDDLDATREVTLLFYGRRDVWEKTISAPYDYLSAEDEARIEQLCDKFGLEPYLMENTLCSRDQTPAQLRQLVEASPTSATTPVLKARPIAHPDGPTSRRRRRASRAPV
jgi:hypothetical protein